jgi:hypothetical protein
LPREMVDHLEATLARQGRLPAIPGYVPTSPHELPRPDLAAPLPSGERPGEGTPHA